MSRIHVLRQALVWLALQGWPGLKLEVGALQLLANGVWLALQGWPGLKRYLDKE